jgi:hypothetical protein
MGLERANSHFAHISEPNAEGSTFISINDRFVHNRVDQGWILYLIKL